MDDLNGDFADEEYSDDDIADLLSSVDSNLRDGRSFRELYETHAVAPAQFIGHGLCFARPLFGPSNRRKQPERYAKFGMPIYSKS